MKWKEIFACVGQLLCEEALCVSSCKYGFSCSFCRLRNVPERRLLCGSRSRHQAPPSVDDPYSSLKTMF